MGKAVIMPRVFISHSQQDNELVRDITRRLRTAGFEACMDSDEVASVADTARELRKELRAAQVLLLLVTPASLNSPWAMRELGMAEALGKVVIPITAGVSQRDLPVPLKSYRAIPFDKLDAAIKKLSAELSVASQI